MELFNDLEFKYMREITRDGNTIVFYRKDDGKYSFSMKDDPMLDCIVHANIDKDIVLYSEIESLCDIIFDKIKNGELELTDDLKCYNAIDLLEKYCIQKWNKALRIHYDRDRRYSRLSEFMPVPEAAYKIITTKLLLPNNVGSAIMGDELTEPSISLLKIIGINFKKNGETIMEQEKKQRGGKRPGAGRKITKNRPNRVTINMSDQVSEILKTKGNKSDYLEELILKDSK